jgi:hypothetical protein
LASSHVEYGGYDLPDNVGEMVWKWKMDGHCSECVPGLEGGCSICLDGVVAVFVFGWAAVVALKFVGSRSEAGYVVGEMFSVGTWWVMWVERGREFSCEEFDGPSISLPVEGVPEHLPVVSEIVRFILVSPGLVPSSDSGNFNCDEFFSGWMCKITIGWAVGYQ